MATEIETSPIRLSSSSISWVSSSSIWIVFNDSTTSSVFSVSRVMIVSWTVFIYAFILGVKPSISSILSNSRSCSSSILLCARDKHSSSLSWQYEDIMSTICRTKLSVPSGICFVSFSLSCSKASVWYKPIWLGGKFLEIVSLGRDAKVECMDKSIEMCFNMFELFFFSFFVCFI